ncbi:hypothetical protein COLO4_16392 [Corchorus olitorius]|uniref:Uncharacterized protein n=1 Tax=Corchorus olitorius TaxID=93759 RepID=A0A1R3JHU7_9ROSI|nr:hypothetical protein COLO4_16392 [Corchorus olitorius]
MAPAVPPSLSTNAHRRSRLPLQTFIFFSSPRHRLSPFSLSSSSRVGFFFFGR